MSRSRFIVTTRARADLIDIWNYIAEDSLESANRVLERLYAAFTRLAEMPCMEHHREDLADARHRFWTVYSYVIAYRDQTRPLEIIAVVHGTRHLEAFFITLETRLYRQDYPPRLSEAGFVGKSSRYNRRNDFRLQQGLSENRRGKQK